jgi:hypothetical protein
VKVRVRSSSPLLGVPMSVRSHILLLFHRLRTAAMDRLSRGWVTEIDCPPRDWVTEIDSLPRDWVTEYRICPSCRRLIAIDRPAGDCVRLETSASSGSSCVRMSVAGSLVHLCRNDRKPSRSDPNGVARVSSRPNSRWADVDVDSLAGTKAAVAIRRLAARLSRARPGARSRARRKSSDEGAGLRSL